MAPKLLLETNRKKQNKTTKKTLSINLVSSPWKEIGSCCKTMLVLLHYLQMSRPHSCSKSDILLGDNKERLYTIIYTEARRG